MLPHPLTNFEIQKYKNEHKFKGVYSRITLLKIKNGTYVINLDECKSIRPHWIILYVNGDNATYFDNFGVEYNLKEINIFRDNKNITTNIYRIQANDSIICK